jgi:hypothetical protein
MTVALNKNNLKLHEEAMSNLRVQLDESKLENEFYKNIYRSQCSALTGSDVESMASFGPVFLIGSTEYLDKVDGLIKATQNKLIKHAGSKHGALHLIALVLYVKKFVSKKSSSIELLELLCEMCNEISPVTVGCHLILKSSEGYDARLFSTRIRSLPIDNLKYTFDRWGCDLLNRDDNYQARNLCGSDSLYYAFPEVLIPSALVANFDKDDVPSVWHSTVRYFNDDDRKSYRERIMNAFYGDSVLTFAQLARDLIKLELNLFSSRVINPQPRNLQHLLKLEVANIVTFRYSNKYGWVCMGSPEVKTVSLLTPEDTVNIIQSSEQSIMKKVMPQCEYLLMKIAQSEEVLVGIDLELENLALRDEVKSEGVDTAFFNAVKYLDGLAGVKGRGDEFAKNCATILTGFCNSDFQSEMKKTKKTKATVKDVYEARCDLFHNSEPVSIREIEKISLLIEKVTEALINFVSRNEYRLNVVDDWPDVKKEWHNKILICYSKFNANEQPSKEELLAMGTP